MSALEAERAIYLDFEGFEDQTPSLLGILIGDWLEQDVFDPSLKLAADAKHLRLTTLDEAVDRILSMSLEQDRLIVGYSQHEKDVIRTFAQRELNGRYRDARMIAKRWKTICHREKPIAGFGLKDFLALINYPRGGHLGEKKSTSRLKAVADMLSRKGNYAALTPVVKGKWTKLLEHNEVDCRGMRALVLLATSELDSGPK